MITEGEQLSKDNIKALKKAIPDINITDVKFHVIKNYARCEEYIAAIASDKKYIIREKKYDYSK